MTGGAGCNSMEPGKRCPGMTETEYRTEFSLWTIGAASMIVSTVRKRLFCAVAFPKKPNVYQDRLGTNIGKVENKETFLSAGPTRHVRLHEGDANEQGDAGDPSG
jgi:hypothetical protein